MRDDEPDRTHLRLRLREDDMDADLQRDPPRRPARGMIDPEPGERGFRPTADEL